MPQNYIDISPAIDESLAVWPGDESYQRNVAMDFSKGDHLTLSAMSGTLHLGAHADAPSHYHAKGQSIDQRNLDFYIGDAQVIKLSLAAGARIQWPDLKGIPVRARRVLFATGSYPDPQKWNKDFNSLSPEVVHYLADQGVVLVGIDTPSIDPFSSQSLEAHNAVNDRDMAILEGLILNQVPEGCYHLVALPLKLKGADASPVRAVLFPRVPGSF